MPRTNRVDPFGDLFPSPKRGLFTGNRGCLVDDSGRIVRHHRGNLWIVCALQYKDWKSPLDAPRHWTPLFFLDDAVALSAGHRPCGLCRPHDYSSYRDAVTVGLNRDDPIRSGELNTMLAAERLNPGRGLSRARYRKVWATPIDSLPSGVVVIDRPERPPSLLTSDRLIEFSFHGWTNPRPRPSHGTFDVLTPPTSILALRNGYEPTLHESATS